MGQNGRFQTTRAFEADIDSYRTAESLKNIVEFATALKTLFIEIHEDDWVIRETDSLLGLAIQKLVKTPGLSVDELIQYFHLVSSSGLRNEAITFWRSKIAEQPSKDALINLNRFFKFAIEDSATMEAWLVNAAKAGADEVASKLILNYELTSQEQRNYLHGLASDQTFSDICVALTPPSDTEVTLARLNGLLSFFEIAVAESSTRADYVKLRANIGLSNTAVKLALSDEIKVTEKIKYFRRVSGSDQRRAILERLAPRIEQQTDKAAIDQMFAFFNDAAEESKTYDSWLPNMAKGYADAALKKLLTSFELTNAEAQLAFHNLRGDQTYSDILVSLDSKGGQLDETDPKLEALSAFLDIAIAESVGRADWVTGRAKGAQDTVSAKLVSSPVTSIEKKNLYFRKITSSDKRRKVLESVIRLVGSVNSKEQLADLSRFFLNAARDSSQYEAWLVRIAQGGADTIAEKLFNNFTLSPEESNQYFARIQGDQVRRDVLNVIRARFEFETNKQKLLEYNTFFLFAANECTKNPTWVQESAFRGVDEIASLLLTKFELTREEMQTFFHQIRGDQSMANVLSFFKKRAEQNRDSGAILLQLSEILEIAVSESTYRADWVLGGAEATLEYVYGRLLKQSVVNADQMIRIFSRAKFENIRNEVLNYWRGKIRRSYNDKASLLGLAKFYRAAEIDAIAKHNGDWILASARFGGSELMRKLGYLFPVFEGVYDVRTSCSGSCGSNVINSVVMLNTLTNDGWQISFMNSASGTTAFTFSGLEISAGGTVFEGMLNMYGTPTKMHLEYDIDTRRIRGWILNSDRVGPINFSGIQKTSTVSIYDDQAALASSGNLNVPQSIPYLEARGHYGDRDATLVVRSLTANGETIIGATMRFDRFRVQFQLGNYNPRNGILVLLGTQPTGARIKLTLATRVRPDGRIDLSGVAFSAQNQSFNAVSFSQ